MLMLVLVLSCRRFPEVASLQGLCMISSGVPVVAQSFRDDGCGEFEELLPDDGAAGDGDRDSDLVRERGQVVGAERHAGPAGGKGAAGDRVGGGVHDVAIRDVAIRDVAIRDVLKQQGGERRGNGRGRLAES
ncbi:hypothetical protein ACQ4WX_48245 [Streptomyces lasalocidi]